MSDVKRVDEYALRTMCVIPILPFVYNDSLSYLETLQELGIKVNEVITAINDVTTEAVEIANQYTDNKIAEQTNFVNEAVNNVNEKVEELNTLYTSFTNLVNAQLTLIRDDMDDLNEYLQAGLNESHHYTDTAILQNNNYLLDELSKGLINLKVLNYFTGEYISVQEMFDYLATFHLGNAISASELRGANITASAFTLLQMSAGDFVRNGKTIILG